MPTSTLRSLDDHDTLRELVRHLRDGLYITDDADRLLDASPAFVALTGAASRDALVGTAFDALLADAAPRRAALAAGDGLARDVELVLVGPDGARRIVRDTVYSRRDGDGHVVRHGVLTEVPASAANRDPLTGAYSARHLDTISGDGEPWGVLYVDIEHTGATNARDGRAAGDELLVHMVRFLMRHVRADEPVVRLANDEFVVILRGATDQRTERVARRLQLTALRTGPGPFALGWAVRVGAESMDALVARAARRRVPVRVAQRGREMRGHLESDVLAPA